MSVYSNKSSLIFALLLSFLIFSFTSPVSAQKEKLATDVDISLVDGIAVDKDGTVYISMRDSNEVVSIDSKHRLKLVAGSGVSGFDGDGGPATHAKLKIPAGLTFDDKGNLYIADRENHRVRRIDSKGIITTVAGNGAAGFGGDGGSATQASLHYPAGVVVDKNGNIYIADRSNNRVRVVDEKGIIQTLAGTGMEGVSGDGGPAKNAKINRPFGLALDKDQNLYIADRNNNRVRKVTRSGVISTVAGDGSYFFSGDNGPAYRASIAGPTGVAVDSDGNLYIADRNNNRIRVVDSNGLIRTVAGTGQQDYNGDSELARETNFYLPFGVALDKDGKLLIIDRSHYVIRRVDTKSGKVETIAGSGKKKFRGDGGPATGAILNFPHGILVDKNDNIIFSDKSHHRIRRISPDGIIYTIAGNGTRGNLGDGGPALEAALYGPMSVVMNSKREIFLLNQSGRTSVIRRIDAKGIIHHFLGTLDEKFLKDIGFTQVVRQDTAFQFSYLALDKQDNLYVPDRINNRIYKIDPRGNTTIFAGTGDADYYGDGGPAKKMAFHDPVAVAVDNDGNIYLSDATNNRIRKIDGKGIASTYAGNGDMKDSGDGGPAKDAGIRGMDDIAISPSGEMYIASAFSHSIRKIGTDGKIVKVAGRGTEGYFGDGGPADQAMFKTPYGIAFDSKGNVYIADMGNNRIRKIDPNGIITTHAGSGTFGWADDGETVEMFIQNFP